MRVISKRTASCVTIAIVVAMIVFLLATTALGYYTWTSTHLSQNVLSLAYDAPPNILYAGCDNGDVYKNEFKGAGWSTTGNLGAGAVFSLAYDATHNILYAGCNDGRVFKNEFKGAGWSTTGNLGAGSVNCLAYDGANNVLYAGCNNGDVDKNEFKGTGWSTTGNLGSAAMSLAYADTHNTLYAGSWAGDVYKNEFKGTGWSTTGNLGSPASSLAYDDTHNILYAGSWAGDVFKNEFKGAGWSTTGSPSGGQVYTLAYDGANNVLYAGTSGINVDNVFKKDLSRNGDWFAIGHLCGGGSVHALKNVVARNILYAGTIDSPLGHQDVYRFELPFISWIYPPAPKQGSTLDIEITGTNTDFHSNVKAHFSGSGIKVNSTKRISATKVIANISIASDATLGQRDVWVTYKNSDGVDDKANLLAGGVFAVTPATAFYFAEGTCRPGFNPYFCIQNPGSSDAEVTITYMKGDGTTDTQALTVPKKARSTVAVKNKLGEGDDLSHDFSAKVECTNGQNIIAERPMYFNYKGVWTGGHDVVGALAPATAFYFAEGTCRPGFDPYLCIQNPGSSDAEVTITYMKGDGTTDIQDATVPRNARLTITVKNRLGEGDNANHDFSAKVECTNGQGIIAERPMYFNYKGVWTGGHDVVGALAPATAFYFAEGTCRPGFDPYLCIQNPGSKEADVKITYMKGDGTTDIQTLTVGRNSRSTVTIKNKLGEGDDPAHDFSAKVECTNGQNIIAERPMYFNYKSIWTGGHDVVGARAPSNDFYFAEGTCRPGFDPYLCIQNPGSSDAKVTITYMKGDGTTEVETLTVGKNSRSTVTIKNKLGEGDDQAHDFSALVHSNGQKIIVERPMYFNYKGVWTGGHDVVGFVPPSAIGIVQPSP